MLALVGVAILRDGLGRGAPPATGSCTQPGFAFDRDAVTEAGVVKWSVRGPSGADVLIQAGGTTLLGPVPLEDCQASGRFGVPLKEGGYTVRVVLRDAGGEREIGTAKLEVDAPG